MASSLWAQGSRVHADLGRWRFSRMASHQRLMRWRLSGRGSTRSAPKRYVARLHAELLAAGGGRIPRGGKIATNFTGVAGRIRLLFLMLQHEKYAEMPLTVNFLSQRHQDLCAHCQPLPPHVRVTVSTLQAMDLSAYTIVDDEDEEEDENENEVASQNEFDKENNNILESVVEDATEELNSVPTLHTEYDTDTADCINSNKKLKTPEKKQKKDAVKKAEPKVKAKARLGDFYRSRKPRQVKSVDAAVGGIFQRESASRAADWQAASTSNRCSINDSSHAGINEAETVGVSPATARRIAATAQMASWASSPCSDLSLSPMSLATPASHARSPTPGDQSTIASPTGMVFLLTPTKSPAPVRCSLRCVRSSRCTAQESAELEAHLAHDESFETDCCITVDDSPECVPLRFGREAGRATEPADNHCSKVTLCCNHAWSQSSVVPHVICTFTQPTQSSVLFSIEEVRFLFGN
eukprot:jgi/Chlat1/3259/Chrsp22S03522